MREEKKKRREEKRGGEGRGEERREALQVVDILMWKREIHAANDLICPLTGAHQIIKAFLQ